MKPSPFATSTPQRHTMTNSNPIVLFILDFFAILHADFPSLLQFALTRTILIGQLMRHIPVKRCLYPFWDQVCYNIFWHMGRVSSPAAHKLAINILLSPVVIHFLFVSITFSSSSKTLGGLFPSPISRTLRQHSLPAISSIVSLIISPPLNCQVGQSFFFYPQSSKISSLLGSSAEVVKPKSRKS